MAPETVSYCIVLDIERDTKGGLKFLVDRSEALGTADRLRVSFSASRSDDPVYRPVGGGALYVAAPPGAGPASQYTAEPLDLGDPAVICWTEGGLIAYSSVAFVALLPPTAVYQNLPPYPAPSAAKSFAGRQVVMWASEVAESGRFQVCWNLRTASEEEVQRCTGELNRAALFTNLPDDGEIPVGQYLSWKAGQHEPVSVIPPGAYKPGWSLLPGHDG